MSQARPTVGLSLLLLLLVVLAVSVSGKEIVPAIPCRDDLAIYAQQKLNKLGRAAEIGVFQGRFARVNVHHWKGQYFMVDAWAYRPSQAIPDKNFQDDAENDHNYELTKAAVADVCPINERCHLIRDLSVSAAARFPDAYFDWIYVDALHTHEAVMQDLRAWYPKLRPGGMISGDDYGDIETTFLMTKQRWMHFFRRPEVWERNQWGVISAVQEFAEEVQEQYFVTWAHDCYLYPAWYLIKSEDNASGANRLLRGPPPQGTTT